MMNGLKFIIKCWKLGIEFIKYFSIIFDLLSDLDLNTENWTSNVPIEDRIEGSVPFPWLDLLLSSKVCLTDSSTHHSSRNLVATLYMRYHIHVYMYIGGILLDPPIETFQLLTLFQFEPWYFHGFVKRIFSLDQAKNA